MSMILAFSTALGIAELSIVLSITMPVTSCASSMPSISSILISSVSIELLLKLAMVHTASTTKPATLSSYASTFD